MRKAMLALAGAAVVLGGAAMAGEEEGIGVGAAVPDFRLNDHAGRGVRLSDFRGRSWVVLAFFPKAATPGWTREVCSLRDAAKELESLGAAVFGLSLDDVASLAEFAKAQGLNFPLLSDPDGSAASKLGALMKDKPYAARVTFVIDDGGVLRHRDSGVKVDSHGKDLVEAIRLRKK